MHHPLFEMPQTFSEVSLVGMQNTKKASNTERERFLHLKKFAIENSWPIAMLSFPAICLSGNQQEIKAWGPLTHNVPVYESPKEQFLGLVLVSFLLRCLATHSHNFHLQGDPFIMPKVLSTSSMAPIFNLLVVTTMGWVQSLLTLQADCTVRTHVHSHSYACDKRVARRERKNPLGDALHATAGKCIHMREVGRR